MPLDALLDRALAHQFALLARRRANQDLDALLARYQRALDLPAVRQDCGFAIEDARELIGRRHLGRNRADAQVLQDRFQILLAHHATQQALSVIGLRAHDRRVPLHAVPDRQDHASDHVDVVRLSSRRGGDLLLEEFARQRLVLDALVQVAPLLVAAGVAHVGKALLDLLRDRPVLPAVLDAHDRRAILKLAGAIDALAEIDERENLAGILAAIPAVRLLAAAGGLRHAALHFVEGVVAHRVGGGEFNVARLGAGALVSMDLLLALFLDLLGAQRGHPVIVGAVLLRVLDRLDKPTLEGIEDAILHVAGERKQAVQELRNLGDLARVEHAG